MAMNPMGDDFKLMTPIAPDVKSPLRPPPVGKPGRQPAFRTPEQLEAIKAARGARQDAFAAARGMQDAAARQAAMKAAQDAFRQEKSSVMNRPIPQTQLGPRTGGDMLPPGKAPITNMGSGSGLAPKAGQPMASAPVPSTPPGMKKGGKTTVVKTASKGRKCDW